MCGRESQTFCVRQFLKREGWGGVSFYPVGWAETARQAAGLKRRSREAGHRYLIILCFNDVKRMFG